MDGSTIALIVILILLDRIFFPSIESLCVAFLSRRKSK